MSAKSEPKTDDVREEQKHSREPCIRLNRFFKEGILNSCGLREKALAAVSTFAERPSAGMTV